MPFIRSSSIEIIEKYIIVLIDEISQIDDMSISICQKQNTYRR
jgi:hypothetical protein